MAATINKAQLKSGYIEYCHCYVIKPHSSEISYA